ncbi:MAG: phenylalanine--tRNA ligase subunit beta [Acidobacteria bacterium]|nr:phenylalanine--tRNA ligase subunit beta [Acidobacteriota bacterium]
MKFSYNWLCELVDGLAADPVKLGQLITMKTAECDGVETFAPWLARVAAAKVLSAEPIEGSHNRKAVVDAGRYGRRTVVCGAPNCRAGMVTAYVPPGTELGSMTIGKRVVDGVESDGMLASGYELGVNRDHSGILELAGDVFEPGPDAVIEIDNKSLTHRPDLWGHHGMAREAAAIAGAKLKEPARLSRIPAGAAPVKVEIEDYTLCPRYSALVFENVTVRPSPLWLQCRLEAVGLNSINNIVDVTNFVMAELAQPMHAFDADKLRGDTIFARPARSGERILALNGETYDLTPSNTVIADAGGPIAIAGVIGGGESAISEITTRIVLESANFMASNVRRTSSALKLRTDASMRFEKAQDPANTLRGLARAIELLEQVSPGIRLVGGLADAWRPKPAPQPITLPLEWLYRKLGRAVEKDEVRRILESIEFGVAEPEPGVFLVTVPSWRSTKDIAIKDDLVEEVGRMIGYGSITPRPPMVAATVPPTNEERRYHRRVRELMTDEGFTEVYNYSFVSDETAEKFGHADLVRVSNPIAVGQNLLRKSLIPGVWKNVLDNARHFDSFRLFEIGQEIHKRAEGLPEETAHLAAAVYAKAGDGREGLFELKRVAQCLASTIEVEAGEALAYEHPARTGRLKIGGETVGRLFEFHPSFVETGRAAVLDIDLGALERLLPRMQKYTQIRRLPASAFDLSVITELRRPVGWIERQLTTLGGVDLLAIEFLREYAGAPLAEGTKSVSFRLTVGAADRTLSSDEVGVIRARIIDGMRGWNYELRV